MAKEVKSVDVHPDNEALTIERFQAFGWEFHSTQEISDNYQERVGDDIYQIREKKIKLTFQRDRNMTNYSQLVELEKEYYAVPSAPYKPVKYGTMWLIITGLGFLLYIIPGILIMKWRNKKYSMEYSEWEKQVAEQRSKKDEIIKRAYPLLI